MLHLTEYQQALHLVQSGVVRHTGKVLACGAVHPRFNSWQGQGILLGVFCSLSGWHTTPVARQVGLVLKHFPFTNAASLWLYVNLICRFHTYRGRFSLRALRFPPTPYQNPFIFLVHSFWSLVVCSKPACLPQVWLPTCALWLSHSGCSALRTQWIEKSRVKKTDYCTLWRAPHQAGVEYWPRSFKFASPIWLSLTSDVALVKLQICTSRLVSY